MSRLAPAVTSSRIGSITTASRSEMAWRRRTVSGDPVPLKKSTQADVSAISTAGPITDPVSSHLLEVSVPTKALHAELFVEAQRSATDKAFQSEVNRLPLGAQSEGLHGSLNEFVVDVNVRPCHCATVPCYVYRRATIPTRDLRASVWKRTDTSPSNASR